MTFLPCPFGFQPSGNPQKCDCAQGLTGIPGVWCDIDTITVHRPAAMWIGNYSNSRNTHKTIVHFDYCASQRIAISVFGSRMISVHVQSFWCSVWKPVSQDSVLLWEPLSVCSAPTFISFSSFHLHWLEWLWCFCCWSATSLFLREPSMDLSSTPTLSESIRPSFFHSQVHCS